MDQKCAVSYSSLKFWSFCLSWDFFVSPPSHSIVAYSFPFVSLKTSVMFHVSSIDQISNFGFLDNMCFSCIPYVLMIFRLLNMADSILSFVVCNDPILGLYNTG